MINNLQKENVEVRNSSMEQNNINYIDMKHSVRKSNILDLFKNVETCINEKRNVSDLQGVNAYDNTIGNNNNNNMNHNKEDDIINKSNVDKNISINNCFSCYNDTIGTVLNKSAETDVTNSMIKTINQNILTNKVYSYVTNENKNANLTPNSNLITLHSHSNTDLNTKAFPQMNVLSVMKKGNNGLMENVKKNENVHFASDLEELNMKNSNLSGITPRNISRGMDEKSDVKNIIYQSVVDNVLNTNNSISNVELIKGKVMNVVNTNRVNNMSGNVQFKEPLSERENIPRSICSINDLNKKKDPVSLNIVNTHEQKNDNELPITVGLSGMNPFLKMSGEIYAYNDQIKGCVSVSSTYKESIDVRVSSKLPFSDSSSNMKVESVFEESIIGNDKNMIDEKKNINSVNEMKKVYVEDIENAIRELTYKDHSNTKVEDVKLNESSIYGTLNNEDEEDEEKEKEENEKEEAKEKHFLMDPSDIEKGETFVVKNKKKLDDNDNDDNDDNDEDEEIMNFHKLNDNRTDKTDEEWEKKKEKEDDIVKIDKSDVLMRKENKKENDGKDEGDEGGIKDGIKDGIKCDDKNKIKGESEIEKKQREKENKHYIDIYEDIEMYLADIENEKEQSLNTTTTKIYEHGTSVKEDGYISYDSSNIAYTMKTNANAVINEIANKYNENKELFSYTNANCDKSSKDSIDQINVLNQLNNMKIQNSISESVISGSSSLNNNDYTNPHVMDFNKSKKTKEGEQHVKNIQNIQNVQNVQILNKVSSGNYTNVNVEGKNIVKKKSVVENIPFNNLLSKNQQCIQNSKNSYIYDKGTEENVIQPLSTEEHKVKLSNMVEVDMKNMKYMKVLDNGIDSFLREEKSIINKFGKVGGYVAHVANKSVVDNKKNMKHLKKKYCDNNKKIVKKKEVPVTESPVEVMHNSSNISGSNITNDSKDRLEYVKGEYVENVSEHNKSKERFTEGKDSSNSNSSISSAEKAEEYSENVNSSDKSRSGIDMNSNISNLCKKDDPFYGLTEEQIKSLQEDIKYLQSLPSAIDAQHLYFEAFADFVSNVGPDSTSHISRNFGYHHMGIGRCHVPRLMSHHNSAYRLRHLKHLNYLKHLHPFRNEDYRGHDRNHERNYWHVHGNVGMSGLSRNPRRCYRTEIFYTNKFDSNIKYNLIEEGSFGVVYKGWFQGVNVAIKIPVDKMPNQDPYGLTKRSINEWKILSKCNHPNIIKLCGGIINGYFDIWIVTELVNGLDLHSLKNNIGKDKMFSLDISLKMCRQLAGVVDFLHTPIKNKKNVIIHRDIKPENLIIDSDWNIHLCDFGDAEECEDGIVTTVSGATWVYAPPELLTCQPLKRGADYNFLEHTKLSYKWDIWSMGCVFQEMMNLPSPFQHYILTFDESNQIYEKLVDVFSKKLPPLIHSKIENSPFADIIKLCLNYDPNLRPTASQIVQLLNQPDEYLLLKRE